MTISLSLKSNAKALKSLVSVAKKKKVPEYLAYIRIIAKNGRITAQATDLESSMEWRLIDSSSDANESFLIHYEAIAKLLTTSNDVIKIRVNEIDTGKALVLNQVLADDDVFPEIASTFDNLDDLEEWTKEEIETFKNAVSNSSLACSNDESRVRLTGINIRNDENNLIVESTDGHRLFQYILPTNRKLNALLPKSSLAILLDIFSQKTSVKMGRINGSLTVVIDDLCNLSLRLINEDFPNVNQIIPKAGEYLIDFAPQKEILKEAVSFCKDMATEGLVIGHNKEFNKFSFSLNTYVYDEIKDLKRDKVFSVSPKFLLDTLSVVSLCSVPSADLNPLLFFSEDGSVKSVLMVRRL